MKYILLLLLICVFAFSASINIQFKDVYFNAYSYGDKNLAVFDTTGILSIINLDKKRVVSSIDIGLNKITALYFYNKDLYAGFSDGYMVKFNSDFSSYQGIAKLKNKIESLYIKDEILYALDKQNQFIVYNIKDKSFEILDILKDISGVVKFELKDEYVYISCWDRNLYRLNLQNKRLKHLLRLPLRGLSIKFIKHINSVLVGLEDGSIFDVSSDKIYQISKDQIDSIASDGKSIYFGNSKGFVTKSDQDFKVNEEVKIFDDRVRALFFDKDTGIFGLSWDGHIRTISNKK